MLMNIFLYLLVKYCYEVMITKEETNRQREENIYNNTWPSDKWRKRMEKSKYTIIYRTQWFTREKKVRKSFLSGWIFQAVFKWEKQKPGEHLTKCLFLANKIKRQYFISHFRRRQMSISIDWAIWYGRASTVEFVF